MSIRSVELFTGAGGLALGLEKVGCHHLAMVEFNAQACDTIRYNIAQQQQFAKDWKVYQSDVRNIRYNEIEVDLKKKSKPRYLSNFSYHYKLPI